MLSYLDDSNDTYRMFSLFTPRFSSSSIICLSKQVLPHLLTPVIALISSLSMNLRIFDKYNSLFIIKIIS